jgi:hypothetical protein
MKKFSVIQVFITSLLATQALAGTLTVSGNLTVTTNLTAQSITLGGVTETNWTGVGSLPLQGYKYVIVSEGTNDVQRGNNLQTAYATATTLGPTISNRVAVIVLPGNYNLGSTNLVMNTSYVDLIGLVPAQMTSKQVFTNSAGSVSTKTIANVQCPVLIYSSASAGTFVQNVDNIQIESMTLTNTGSGSAYVIPTGSCQNTVLRHVSMSSMLPRNSFAGQYIDCVCTITAFGNASATGTFIDCVGGDNSFAGGVISGMPSGGNAIGTFINCTGGDYSFAGGEGVASGTFRGCVGGIDSFAGTSGMADGTFIDCVGGANSFAGYDGALSQDNGVASGTFVDCVGGDGAFASNGDASGAFTECVGGANSFGGNGGTLDTPAKLRHCQGGTGSFGSYGIASQDFNYNVGGTNTFLMLPQLPTSTNGLPSGSVYNSGGALMVIP